MSHKIFSVFVGLCVLSGAAHAKQAVCGGDSVKALPKGTEIALNQELVITHGYNNSSDLNTRHYDDESDYEGSCYLTARKIDPVYDRTITPRIFRIKKITQLDPEHASIELRDPEKNVKSIVCPFDPGFMTIDMLRTMISPTMQLEFTTPSTCQHTM